MMKNSHKIPFYSTMFTMFTMANCHCCKTVFRYSGNTSIYNIVHLNQLRKVQPLLQNVDYATDDPSLQSFFSERRPRTFPV